MTILNYTTHICYINLNDMPKALNNICFIDIIPYTERYFLKRDTVL